MNSFNKTVDLLHRALDASSMRRSIIANNIANAQVPNFKRSDLNFETELKRALDSEKQKPELELRLTDSRHISNRTTIDYQTVTPRRVLDYISTSNNNGNNVDADQEFMRALENQMTYTVLAQAETFEFSQINIVLR
ncbi:MAG: flagellar basal body rod protein FlgB [Spirochaetaceae bacterium]|jgi:flagellar basal-body rod protein FlgB|nr:flagellar basal body rod protein FlgB [Spirochaetaceae bacterium]